MISIWIFIIVVLILIGIIINEIKINLNLKKDYDELLSDNRRVTMELGYMRLRYGKSNWEDIKNGVGLPQEIKQKIKIEEA
jgi:hypothetical protein